MKQGDVTLSRNGCKRYRQRFDNVAEPRTLDLGEEQVYREKAG